MSDLQKAKKLISAAIDSLNASLELLEMREVISTSTDSVDVEELRAQLAVYKNKLARPKGKGGKPLKKSELKETVHTKLPPREMPKQTRVQEEIHKVKGSSPEVFFGENDSLGARMMRGATEKEDLRSQKAKRRKL